LRLCEDVYRMHLRQSVVWATPPSFRLDVEAPFYNHWQVKGALLKEIPASGVRLYNYFDDGTHTTVGSLERLGYVQLCDPETSHPLAIVDEHWSYAIRSAAAAVLTCKWLGPRSPRILALLGVGTMASNALRCLLKYYEFAEIRCTSRRAESREAAAKAWSKELGTRVVACLDTQEAAQDADIVVGGTSSGDVMCRENWLKPGCTFISLSPTQLAPADWARMDKVVVDSWDWNCLNPVFRSMIDAGYFSRTQLHAEIPDIVCEKKSGRIRSSERILIHTAGLVSQDIAIAHYVFVKAKERNAGIWLPAARRSSRQPKSSDMSGLLWCDAPI
jgi:ornithine cyclodeaminase/alanine dehydrogenase-like protein (mu-crystallin family)